MNLAVVQQRVARHNASLPPTDVGSMTCASPRLAPPIVTPQARQSPTVLPSPLGRRPGILYFRRTMFERMGSSWLVVNRFWPR
jgi:hypothetical protein